ncbi:MAG: hypothetical protein ACFB5Z_20455 [Elainellaceae cyanobacterium]
MDQVLGILIGALVISIVIGAIVSGAQRLLGFGIIAAIATVLIGMVTGSSFSLPNAAGTIQSSNAQPDSGLPERIETINPAAGSGSTAPGSAFSPGQSGDAATAQNSGSGSGTAGGAATGSTAAGGAAAGSTAAGSAATGSAGASGTAPSNTSATGQPVNALW